MNIRMIMSATALLLASASGVAYASTSGGSPAPGAFASWKAQIHAEKVCAPVKDDMKWEVCLLKSYHKDTKRVLSSYEYETNGVKGTWKVTWSHVVLPSGGEAIDKKAKAEIGVPTAVYCKVYTADESQAILCNNGDRH